MGSVPTKQNLGKKAPSLDRSQSIRRAKERANLDKGSWDQLNWYVNFTKLNFDKLSDGDILNIQDEVAALCSIVEGHLGGRPLLSLKRLRSIQLDIFTKLSNLVDHQKADYWVFHLYGCVVHRLQELMAKSPEFDPEALRDVPKVNISKRFSHCKTPEKMIVIILMNHLIGSTC